MMQRQKGWASLMAALAILAAAGVAPAVTICDVQEYDAMGLSPLDGDDVTVQGVVTLEPGVFQPTMTSFYIEWEGCGINVYNSIGNFVSASRGDTIEVTGVVEEYQSGTTGAGSTTEIIVSSWRMLGEATEEPEPTYVNLKELAAEENEGRLCRTIGVVREKNMPYDFYIHQPWSGADIQVYRAGSLDLDVFAVGDTVDITGIIMQYDRTPPFFDGYELSPRIAADMKRAVPPPPPDPEFWPNSALRIPSQTFRPDGNEVIPIAYLAPDRSRSR